VNGTSVNASYPRLFSFFGFDVATRRIWAERGGAVTLAEKLKPARIVETT